MKKKISNKTVIEFLFFCREVCEVYASHNYNQLGGKFKTIEADECFLSKRKYNRGRITSSMTQTIFGIYCREDKEGLFFRVNGKSKRDLWPIIHKYCHPETAVICTDSARQYKNVHLLFNDAVHKTTNHRKGEFVDKNDVTNTINSLENQNKILKATIRSRRNDVVIRQNMAVYFYRRRRLPLSIPIGERIHHFLEDIREVYPGPGKEGKQLLELELPTPESEGIEELMPPPKRPKREIELEPDGDVPFIDDPVNDPDWLEGDE